MARERARTLGAWASSTCKGVVLAGMRVSVTKYVLLFGGRIGANTDPTKVGRFISNRDIVRAAFIRRVFEKKMCVLGYVTFICCSSLSRNRKYRAIVVRRLSIFHLTGRNEKNLSLTVSICLSRGRNHIDESINENSRNNR